MTTVIVSDTGAACDSLWTFDDGVHTVSDINKYLFVSGYVIAGYNPDPFIVFYSGTYNQIVLHQALMLDLIDYEGYMSIAKWLSSKGENRLQYIKIDINDWRADTYNSDGKNGVHYAGSGGQLAADHYPNCYDLKLCVEFAITKDKFSGPEVSLFNKEGARQDNIFEVSGHMYDTLYNKTNGLMQDYRGDIDMSNQIKQTAPDGKEIDHDTLESAISRDINNMKKNQNVSTLWISIKNAKKKENIIKKKKKITA